MILSLCIFEMLSSFTIPPHRKYKHPRRTHTSKRNCLGLLVPLITIPGGFLLPMEALF